MRIKDLKKQIAAHSLSRKDGTYTARLAFYWRRDDQKRAFHERIKAIPGAVIEDSGERFVGFNGGHTVSQGSHWWVKFRIAP